MSLSDLKVKVSALTILTFVMFSISAVKSADAAGAGFEGKEYEVGLELGIWMPGTISVEDADLDKGAGPLFRVFADAYLMPKFAVGAYFNYSSATVEYTIYEADAKFYEFGIGLKPRFILSPEVALKPGLNIGYRKSTRDKLAIEAPDTETDADGLAINLSVELQYMIDSDYIVFFDGGFLSQPTGGNSDADVTWAPIIYFAAGICF